MPDPTSPSPDNPSIAARLRVLSDYLAFEGESTYRVLAYRKAAERLEELTESVAELARQGRLREIPGVGAAIEAKVRELLDTGHIAVLDERAGRYPEGLIELIRLPGVGPKTARRLWEDLGVGSVKELRAAAEEGRIRELSGMGAKTEAKLLEAAASEIPSDRRLRGVVQDQAEKLVAALRSLPGVEEAELAGSIRRRRSTVRDIDLVAGSSSPRTVVAAFCELRDLAAVEERGETKVVARGHNGIGIDLRAVSPGSFGNLLQHSTGSAGHNVALRGLARRAGFKMSEYDLEDTATGCRLSRPDEAGVYEALGLSWIPPELREDRGELEAARDGLLPHLIERGDLRGDLHVHSDWSDGRSSVEDMATAARARGLGYVCFCDHSVSLGMGVGLSGARVREQVRHIREVDTRLDGIRVLAGSEVDILADGRIDLPDEVLSELDFVTASIHSGFGQPMEKIMDRFFSALELPWVDAIGHPTGRLLGRRRGYEIDIDALSRAAADTGTFLEINAAYDRLDLRCEHARRAKELGARMIVSSDAHFPEGYDFLRFGIDEARRGWLERADVANCLEWEELRGMLRRNRRR